MHPGQRWFVMKVFVTSAIVPSEVTERPRIFVLCSGGIVTVKFAEGRCVSSA